MRFQQIFMNLLSNAIKYTPAGGQIRFIVEGMGKEGEVLHIRGTVQDTGVGMSSEFIKKSLYKPYAQEHNGFSDQYAGSGLGLVITKSIVDQMGGKITVSSKEGEGTTFVVELALMETECPHRIENEKKSVEFTGMALKGKHILLCEDHPLNAEIAVKLLTQKGCMVDVAENGKLGADKFLASPRNYYDAILMDIRMPVMDGLEAAKIIRSYVRKDAKTIPIIAMTANAYTEDIVNTREAGMNMHLSKPVEPKELYRALEKYIGNRKE